MRNVWKYYYSSTDGVIFVIDASNKERVLEAKDELSRVLANEDARQIPILVFANKQDLSGCLNQKEVADLLGVLEVNKFQIGSGSNFRVQESSAVKD